MTLAPQHPRYQHPHLRVPNPPPITVVLSPPPLIVFAEDDTHTLLPSYDIPDVIDPATTPLVATTDKLPSTPAAALQTIDVSDTQSEPSAPLRPTRPAALYLHHNTQYAPQLFKLQYENTPTSNDTKQTHNNNKHHKILNKGRREIRKKPTEED